MVPDLRPGDCLVVCRDASVRLGDVVVARSPEQPPLLVVKRVVYHAPEGWWLESDNQRGSRDSWLFGAVPDSRIVGRVVGRYWPLRRASLRSVSGRSRARRRAR